MPAAGATTNPETACIAGLFTTAGNVIHSRHGHPPPSITTVSSCATEIIRPRARPVTSTTMSGATPVTVAMNIHALKSVASMSKKALMNTRIALNAIAVAKKTMKIGEKAATTRNAGGSSAMWADS